MRVDLYRGGQAAGGGGGSAAPGLPQGTAPPGGSVGFNQELFIGLAGTYGYSSGSVTNVPGLPFASTLTRFRFGTAAMVVNATVRLRTAGGTELYSKVLAAGETLIDETISVAVGAGVIVQCSVTPASGTPAIDAWSFGWTRELS